MNRKFIKDKGGCLRYEKNRVVDFLLMSATNNIKCDLNHLWRVFDTGAFTLDEMKEFYQLIGYSDGGFHEIFDKFDEKEKGQKR